MGNNWFCTKCGNENQGDHLFCIYCGAERSVPAKAPIQNQNKTSTGKGIIVIAVVLLVIFAALFFIFKDRLFNSDSHGAHNNDTEISKDDPDVLEFKGHYYKLVDDPMYWTQAKAAAEDAGGHLVVITSKEEQNFVVNLIEKYGTLYHYWLGASDAEEEGVWKWVTGEIFWRGDANGMPVSGMYNNWLVGQPNNTTYVSPSGQNYLEIQATRGDHGDEEYMTWTDIDDSGVAYNTATGDDFREAPDYNSTKYYGYIIEWDE